MNVIHLTEKRTSVEEVDVEEKEKRTQRLEMIMTYSVFIRFVWHVVVAK